MKSTSRPLGLLCAALLLGCSPLMGADTLTIDLDTTKTKVPVPGQFTGLFEASNSHKTNSSGVAFFDPSNPKYIQYKNLIKQMGVTHWRVEGGGDGTTAGTTQTDQVFSFITATGLTGPSVMWGLWLYRDPGIDPINPLNSDNPLKAKHILSTPADASLLQAFAFGNEIDYNSNINGPNGDPYVSGYSTNKTGAMPPYNWVGAVASGISGTPGYWEIQHSWVQTTATNLGVPVSFMGCDTGGFGTGATLVGSTPWMRKFAVDEHANVIAATQHLYVGNGNSQPRAGDNVGGVPSWSPGKYAKLDEVYDPMDTDANTGEALLWQCTAGVNSTSNPSLDTVHWKRIENIWASGTYAVGDVVRDESPLDGNAPGTRYQCVVGKLGTNHPGKVVNDANSMWVYADREQYALPGPHQLAQWDLDPARPGEWTTAISTQLTGNASWPHGLPLRMTEFSPYAGPKHGAYEPGPVNGKSGWYATWNANPANPPITVVNNTPAHTDSFASALIGLEMFHPFARAGIIGVNPEEGSEQTNSPIFQSPNGSTDGDFVANPYAYVWPAFNLSAFPGSGSELLPSTGSTNNGIKLSGTAINNSDNLSVYADVTSSDLVVTIINKSYTWDGLSGSKDLSATINLPTGFTPSNVRTMRLDPNKGGASGNGGDSTFAGPTNVYLGNVTLDKGNSTLPNPWSPTTGWGGSFTITVPAFTAVMVDLQH